MASIMESKFNSDLNRLAFRPSFSGECASELESRVYLSKKLHIQLSGGSVESPVSTAWIWLMRSSKQSSMRSNPDFDPKTENHGVQMCAGIKKLRSDISSVISSKSRTSSPRIGRPSEVMLKFIEESLF